MSIVESEVYNACLVGGLTAKEAEAAAQALTERRKATMESFFDKKDISTTIAMTKLQLIKWGAGIGFAQAAFVATLLHNMH